ncbi:chromate transporter [Mycoplasmatota bacterium]|nr:chromate transporter [Mycoplasmatota bacterium]
MLLLRLFFTFAKIALFNFGGGFVMISLIRQEIVGASGFGLTDFEFSNIIAISQMTPGAIAINTATYVGYKIAGVLGAVFATIAIPIPSFFIVIFLSPILVKYKEHHLNKMIFYGIRAVVVGLIINAAIIVSRTPFFAYENKEKEIYSRFQLIKIFKNVHLPDFISHLNVGSIGIFLISLLLLIKYKMNPILVIFISACLGVLIFHFNV